MTNTSKETDIVPLTLAIYPNAIGFGYAVVYNPQEPVDCGVQRMLPISNEACLRRFRTLLVKFRPQTVVLQRLKGTGSYKSQRVCHLLSLLKKEAEKKGVTVFHYTRKQIRDVFTNFDLEKATKAEIAEVIAKYLPMFQHQLPPKRDLWMSEGYHQGMFDALSLVITHFYLVD